jgi:TetR/AcrR family transcriptional regulator, lmrAB and yxaGH operons repressor
MTVRGLVRPGGARRTTRRRMLTSAVEVLRERGAAGVTIDEVLARSKAPRGSVYHHFPGGRNQMLIEALLFAGDTMTAAIDNAASEGPMALLRQFVELWQEVLRDSDFAAGCPVVAAAISTADEDPRLSAEAAEIFQRWRTALTRSFEADGFDGDDAASLAITTIAAIEGAVVLCRSLRSAAPLREVTDQLEFLINAKKFVSRYGRPVVPQ